jgi:hypothetical protein
MRIGRPAATLVPRLSKVEIADELRRSITTFNQIVGRRQQPVGRNWVFDERPLDVR